jgi:preprotein translocase subunit SecE
MTIKENYVVKYVSQSIEELKKVVWPTKKTLKQHTLYVIAISLGVAAFLGAVDQLLTIGVEKIIK